MDSAVITAIPILSRSQGKSRQGCFLRLIESNPPSYHLFWQTISRWFVSFSTSPKFACFMSLSGRKRQIKVYEKKVIVRVMAEQFAVNRIYSKSVTPFEWSLGGVKKLYNQWKQKRQNFFSKNFIFPVNSFFVIFISEKQWQRRIETGKNWPTFSSF